MKKNNYSYCLQVIIAITVLMASLSSCLSDDLTREEEPGIIVVSLNGMISRAAGDPINTGDEEIKKVRIFVFVGEVLEKNELFTEGSGNFNNPFVLEVITGTKEVYVVANESATLKPALETTTTKTGLMAVLADQISAPLTLPLLMTGSTVGVAVAAVEDPVRNSTTVTLTRVSAKISLQFKKDTDAEVKITKVSLLSNTGKTPIWGGETILTGQSYWNHEVDLSSPLELSATPVTLDPVYIYENLTGGDKDNAVQLEVEALYNNVPAKYRVYINENVSSPANAGDPSSSVTDPDDHLYSVKRNHYYQLTGTIRNIGEFDGLMLTTLVLPWNYLPASFLFERTFTISPTPTPANFTYTVDGNGKACFTFKLTNPIDASWVANLSNPTDFEFESAYQGETDDEVTITVKTKNTPGMEERTTEFYINVQYGGNWAEIPLLSGSSLTGAGNRVVIKQPAQ